MKRLLFALALVLVVVAPPARAQVGPPPLGESLTGEAKALYEMGKSAFDAGDVPGALTKFTRAHELSRDPRLMWNMAACEAGLKHYARAMTLVDRYLRAADSYLPEKDRTQARRFHAAARPLVAVVKLTTVPADVQVSVDGEALGTIAPDGMLYLDAGRRRITFQRAGHRGLVRTETVTGGAELTWKVELSRLHVKVLGE